MSTFNYNQQGKSQINQSNDKNQKVGKPQARNLKKGQRDRGSK